MEDQWKEVGKVHELVRKRVMEVPLASVNDACVNELWMKNRKEKNIRESNEALFKTVGKTLYKSNAGCTGTAKRRGNNWMSTTKQELERLGMEDICEYGGNNDKKIWLRTRKKTC